MITMLLRALSHFRWVHLSDGLPQGWRANIEWQGVRWRAVGTYWQPGLKAPIDVVSGWTLRKSTAIEQVGYWIEDAIKDPGEWMPVGVAYTGGCPAGEAEHLRRIIRDALDATGDGAR